MTYSTDISCIIWHWWYVLTSEIIAFEHVGSIPTQAYLWVWRHNQWKSSDRRSSTWVFPPARVCWYQWRCDKSQRLLIVDLFRSNNPWRRKGDIINYTPERFSTSRSSRMSEFQEEFLGDLIISVIASLRFRLLNWQSRLINNRV